MPGSPKKKKSKRKATDSDLKAPEGQEGGVKRARAQVERMSQQNPRHSGRPGARKGGRNTQLEKIGAILHAPMRTNQAKGATSLDTNIPANPLAPEPPRKGHGSHSKTKQPPPPYSPSETLNVTTSKSRSKKTKASIAPALTFELMDDQPTFSQREAGGRYGFSPPIVPIVPPGTEPDLQALNNPFMANARRLQSPSASQSQAPASEAHRPIAAPQHTNFYHNLDPALRSSALSTDSEGSDSSKDEDSPSDEGGEDEQIGWGEVFQEKNYLSQPQVVTALPVDFEFQHSCDEDDQVAERTLAVSGDLSEGSTMTDQESAPQLADVLRVHHEKNGHPHLPDPALLDLLHAAEVAAPNSKAKIKAKMGIEIEIEGGQ
ncbi:uncharacterized protein F5147DRAFT_781785 [Suillus discolor]|uniref:Uncharacterized protein n=1 Tax=Suillus discolor TaxID=1912936 RepID=A0A9P7ESS7_9AGAM|nr:uncharacterized protein F5147DRAFT_781785 [Suillus discolor]KAG2086079.1 hypothetical protein F5147DRAFT_781785 [Suillus discolor]